MRFFNLYQHEETGRTQISSENPGKQWACVGKDVVATPDGSYVLFDAHDKERMSGEYLLLQEMLDKAGVPREENGAILSLWGRVIRLPNSTPPACCHNAVRRRGEAVNKKIPTVRRAKWHRECDRWQVQNEDGRLCSCNGFEPFCEAGNWWNMPNLMYGAPWNGGPKLKPPKDYAKTLRRIVDKPRKTKS